MAYTKTLWQKGDVLTAEKLNKLEGGIENAHSVVDTIQAGTSTDAGSDTNIASTAYVQAKITEKINTLDSSFTFSAIDNNYIPASYTLTGLKIDNGKISQISQSLIAIAKSQVSGLVDTLNSLAPIDSPVFTTEVTLPGDPTAQLHAATKGYVDSIIASLDSSFSNGTASKTLTGLNITDGKITQPTYTDIAISKSQVSGLSDSLNTVSLALETNAASEINLVANTLYLLKAGDGSIAFTTPPVPTKVSELTNDSGFLTAHQDISMKLSIPSSEDLEPGDYVLTMHIPSEEEEETEITYRWVANPQE